MKILGTLFSLFLVFFGLHTEIALAPGKRLLLPYVLCFIGAVGILFLNGKLIRFRIISLYGVLFIALAVCAGITAQNDGNLPQHVLSTGQLLYSLVIAYGIFIGIQVIGLRMASRFFLLSAIILIVGSFLELHGGLKPVSDAFRDSVNSWQARTVYKEDLRDVLDYGGIRPKFFATEPALLGAMTGFAILFWFLSTRRYSGLRLFGAMLLGSVAFILVRSPTILICCIVIFSFFLSEAGRRTASRVRIALLCLGVLVAIVVVPPLAETYTMYGRSASFFVREVGPPLVTAKVLQSRPLLGTGIGGWDQVVPYGQSVFNHANSGAYEQLQKTEADVINAPKNMMASALWEFWMDLGLLGGVVVLWILSRAMRELNVPHRLLVFSCSALIFTVGGGLVIPLGWAALFAIASLHGMHAEALSEEKETLSEPQPARIAVGLPGWSN